MIESSFFRDDPDRVRELLSLDDNRARFGGDWYVFETISADGSWAIGVRRGSPDPSLVMIVYENLSQPIATLAAQGLAEWHRSNGRNVGGAGAAR